MNAAANKVWAIASGAALGGVSVVLPWITAPGTTIAVIEGEDGPLLLGAAGLAANPKKVTG